MPNAHCFSLSRLSFSTVDLELNFIDLNVKMKASSWYDLTKQAGGISDGLMGLQIEQQTESRHIPDRAQTLSRQSPTLSSQLGQSPDTFKTDSRYNSNTSKILSRQSPGIF